MINTLIHRFLKRRHFWRYATFSEVAELYASRMLRMFALRLVSTFTAVFLYQEGFSLLQIGLFWGAFYLSKVFFSYPSALIVARRGPKHATLYSNVMAAFSMVALPFVTDPAIGLAALVVWGGLQAFSSAMYDLAYLVDFSKVKHDEHAGKEIGYMSILEKLASGLSPLLGGIIALFFGPESIMLMSGVFFMLSAVPLFLTAEPVKLQHSLNFRRYPWRMTWRSFVAETAIGFDVFTTSIAWSLFLVVVIFVSGTDRVYAEIGAVASVTLLFAFAASYTFGRLIDHRRGFELLKFSTYFNSFVHVIRPFVSTPAGVVLTNGANEVATTGYAMPFLRGMFDLADRSKKRIEYIFVIEMVANFGAFLAAMCFVAIVAVVEGSLALQTFFVVAAAVTLLIKSAAFPLYRR